MSELSSDGETLIAVSRYVVPDLWSSRWERTSSIMPYYHRYHHHHHHQFTATHNTAGHVLYIMKTNYFTQCQSAILRIHCEF